VAQPSSRGTCPLLLSLAGASLVSTRQSAGAAPAACLVRLIPAAARWPGACVPLPQRSRGLALVHRWAPMPSA